MACFDVDQELVPLTTANKYKSKPRGVAAMQQLRRERTILDLNQILAAACTVRFPTILKRWGTAIRHGGHGRPASGVAGAPALLGERGCARKRPAARRFRKRCLHFPGIGAAELRASDRPAVRHLPHRFPRPDPL